MRPLSLPFAAALASSLGLAACVDATPPPRAPDPAAVRAEATAELDDFHAAAAAADENRYFAHFASDGVFLGTDATERWNVAAFRQYAHARFAKGKGWTYQSVRRVVSMSPSGVVVWFDEDLKNAHVGVARGTGVLVREGGKLKIAQYNLTVPIPNDKMTAVVDLIDPRPPAPPTLEAVHKKAYEAATTFAGIDPLEDAARALLEAMPEAKRHPDADAEFWLHNDLTWIRWQQGDLARALSEVDAAGVTLDHGTLPEPKKTMLRLHELWDRAYLLLDVATQAPKGERDARLAAAMAAKAAYEKLAAPNGDADGMAVLSAYFLVQTGKAKEAGVSARKVDLDRDEDLQDLYVIAKALDASGDHAGADAVVARICAGHTYLMKPLIVDQLAREGRRCAAR